MHSSASVETGAWQLMCGPFVVEWRLNDPRVLEPLARRGHESVVHRPPDLLIDAWPTLQEAPSSLEPLPPVTMRADRDGRTVHMRFWGVAQAVWDVPGERIVCRYAAALTVERVAELLDCLSYWIIATWLHLRGAVLLHACGVLHGGRVDVFAGRSGVGKSTLARSAPHASVLHDDTLILMANSGWCEIYQSPWRRVDDWVWRPGQHWPVDRIFVLTREGAVRAEPMPPQETLAFLFKEWFCSVAGLPQLYRERLRMLGGLVEQHPGYRLRYRWGQDDPWALAESAQRGALAR